MLTTARHLPTAALARAKSSAGALGGARWESATPRSADPGPGGHRVPPTAPAKAPASAAGAEADAAETGAEAPAEEEAPRAAAELAPQPDQSSAHDSGQQSRS